MSILFVYTCTPSDILTVSQHWLPNPLVGISKQPFPEEGLSKVFKIESSKFEITLKHFACILGVVNSSYWCLQSQKLFLKRLDLSSFVIYQSTECYLFTHRREAALLRAL